MTTKTLLAIALAAAAAAALASCGSGGGAELLPGNTAGEITANLDKVKRLASEGECAAAQDAGRRVSDQIDALGGVDKKLKQALREGAARLNEVLVECEATTTTEAPEPAGVPAEPPGKEKKPKKEPKKPKTPPAPGLPPQSNGKGKGLGNGNPNSPGGSEGGDEGASSGGIGPGAPVGTG